MKWPDTPHRTTRRTRPDRLARAVDIANTLLAEDGIRGTYWLDTSETPVAICFAQGETVDVLAYLDGESTTLTDTGQRDGTLEYALKAQQLLEEGA